MLKIRSNKGEPVNLFYWRDKTGHEVDLIIDSFPLLTPIEIKSGKTVQADFFRNLKYWTSLNKSDQAILLYGGSEKQMRSNGFQVLPWRTLAEDNL